LDIGKDKTIKGIFWTSIETFGGKIITFIIGIVIARILEPKDYGIIGMAYFFISIAQIFLVSGFITALLQKKEVSEIDYSTVFIFQVFFSILLYLFFFIISVPISNFYNEKTLVPIIRVLSLNIVFNSFIIVQNTYLTKEMKFKSLAKINLIAISIGSTSGLLCAIYGFGVWALVLQSTINSLSRSILLWSATKFRFKLNFSKNSFLLLYKYAFKLFLSSFLKTTFDNIYYIIIGKIYAAKELGYYTKARQLQQFVVNNVFTIISKSTFPYFSSLQDDKEKLKEVYVKSLLTLSYILFPLMTFFIIISDNLITILLTEKWFPASTFFKLLCLSGMIIPLNSITYNILNAKGLVNKTLILTIIEKLLVVISVLLTYNYTIINLLTGYFAAVLATFIVSIYFVSKYIKINFFSTILKVLKLAISNLFVGLIVLTSVIYLDINSKLIYIFVVAILFFPIIFIVTKFFKLIPVNFKSIITKQLKFKK